MTKRLAIFLTILLNYHLSMGQINILDSCGVDLKPTLNQYEIKIIDSLFLPPYKTKKEIIDPKDGFELKGKRIAFYSCTKDSNTKDGVLSKKEFFMLCRPNFKGHAGRGIITFNEVEKKGSKGFEAVIIIDCPYDLLTTKDLILKLKKTSD